MEIVHRSLADDGLFLLQTIGNNRTTVIGDSWTNKYIFPGSELDDIGHTIQVMEGCGLEVHDVENLRPHYAKTCRLWYERLLARSNAAVEQVGYERYRMWLVYIAAVARTFDLGSMRIYQTVATKRAMISGNVLPPTRADLYLEA